MPKKKTIGDTNFKKVLKELEDYHEDNPTIRLGAFIQASVDTKKKILNNNLNDVSTKEILTSVKNYRKMLKEGSVKGVK